MASSGLVSIGYEGRSVTELVVELCELRVDVLVDVRLTPLSRKPGLSKQKLTAHLAAAGIEYLHLKALGNPSDNREHFWRGRVEVGCQVFEELLALPEPQSALETVAQLSSRRRVALLCFERDHDRCHRQVVTMRVTELSESKLVVYA